VAWEGCGTLVLLGSAALIIYDAAQDFEGTRAIYAACRGMVAGRATSSQAQTCSAVIGGVVGGVLGARAGALVRGGLEAARGAASTVTVGRWMSQAELKAMQTTGRVQESFNAGVTSVTLPANPAAYGAARAGDVFVRFDVPQSAIGAADGAWGKIFGPNSIFGPIKGITEMPPATNIVVSP
jgi:hypothetical protein